MKLYFASQPQWDDWILAAKHKYILISYFWLMRKVNTDFDFHKYFQRFKDAGMTVMIDSGAHTLQKGKQNPDYQAFFEGYLKWLGENIDLIDHYVELDIENVVGLDKVNEWSDTLTAELKKPPIRVWHRWRGGLDVWERMTQENDYIGFSGFLIQQGGGAELPPEQLPYYLKVARNNGCKVHGFGMTAPKKLETLPFYSIDSSSWMSGQRFGVIHYFDGRVMKIRAKNEIRKSGRSTRDYNWKDSLTFNTLQWKLYADYLERNGGDRE